MTHLRKVKGSSPDTAAGNLANDTDVTVSIKRKYPYSTHSASSNSTVVEHLAHLPKVKGSSPDIAASTSPNVTDVNIIYKKKISHSASINRKAVEHLCLWVQVQTLSLVI